MILSRFIIILSFLIFFENSASVDYSINAINRIDFDEGKDQIVPNSYKFLEEIKGKVIYCTLTSVLDHFCFYSGTFSIAANHTFDCEEKYLGITISFPSDESPDNKTGFENHHAYLTNNIIGEYTFASYRQVSTTHSNCQFVKQ